LTTPSTPLFPYTTLFRSMNYLEVPDELARCSVEGYDRVAEQARPYAVGSIKIVRRRADREEDHAAINVHTHHGPHIRSGAVLPAVPVPRFVSWLAGLGNGVKSPEKFARSDIEGANRTARPLRRVFLKPRSRNNKVFVNRRRRGYFISFLRPVIRHVFAEVNKTTIAETQARLTRSRV